MTKIESTYVNEAIRNNKSKENELYARKIRCIFDKEGYKKICFTKGKRIILFQSRINGCSRMTKKKKVEQKKANNNEMGCEWLPFSWMKEKEPLSTKKGNCMQLLDIKIIVLEHFLNPYYFVLFIIVTVSRKSRDYPYGFCAIKKRITVKNDTWHRDVLCYAERKRCV